MQQEIRLVDYWITDLDNRLHDVIVHSESGRPEAAAIWAAQAWLNNFYYVDTLITKTECNG